MFIIYADASNSNVTLSPRYADLGDLQSLSFIKLKYKSLRWEYYKQWLSRSVALLHMKTLWVR